jgi:tRNA U54 and U55 pseudouridine synthase Pus10
MKKNDLITHAEKNSYVARNLQKKFYCKLSNSAFNQQTATKVTKKKSEIKRKKRFYLHCCKSSENPGFRISNCRVSFSCAYYDSPNSFFPSE